MDKIDFKNGSAPYLSANNLNKLQENVEKALVGEEWITATLEPGVSATTTGYGRS